MRGLSERNLEYMQTFASTWPYYPFPQPAVAELATTGQTGGSSIPQLKTAELQFNENQHIDERQSLLSRIPWTHHMIILDKVKTPEERFFYIKEAISNGWNSNMLKVNIETCLHKRQGNAITNFDSLLSENQAELARLTLKNPYVFDFLDIEIEAPMHERDLERALLKHIQRFLLELGKGFAYVGNQFNVKVQEDEFALDLLFFNYNLNCFVVFELKARDFKSEYAGKLNFYVNIIDAQIKLPVHNPTIGVILCKTPNDMVVKYSLQGIQTPLGVAEYELMPKQLKTEMPTIEELELELEKEIEIMQSPIDEKKNKLKDILAKVKEEEIKKA